MYSRLTWRNKMGLEDHTGQTWLWVWPDSLVSLKDLRSSVTLMLPTPSFFKLPSAKTKTNEAKRKLHQILITGLTTLHFPLTTPAIQIQISQLKQKTKQKKPKFYKNSLKCKQTVPPSCEYTLCIYRKQENDSDTCILKP